MEEALLYTLDPPCSSNGTSNKPQMMNAATNCAVLSMVYSTPMVGRFKYRSRVGICVIAQSPDLPFSAMHGPPLSRNYSDNIMRTKHPLWISHLAKVNLAREPITGDCTSVGNILQARSWSRRQASFCVRGA